MSAVARLIQAENARIEIEKKVAAAGAELERQHRQWLLAQLQPMVDEFNAQQYKPRVKKHTQGQGNYDWAGRGVFYVREFLTVQLRIGTDSLSAVLSWVPIADNLQKSDDRTLVHIHNGTYQLYIPGEKPAYVTLPSEVMERALRIVAPWVEA